MKTMTTAEFGRTGLASFTEPVEVKRYATVVGIWYPTGGVLPPSDPDLMGHGPSTTQKRVEELEEEIKHLKKLLAAKAEKAPVDPVAKAADVDRRVSGLHQQDLDYINRKLGKK